MALLGRLWNVLRRARLDDDLRQEFETHLALIEEDECAHGLTGDQARRKARLRFGNPLSYRERALDAVIATGMEHASADLRHAVRVLRKNPGFTSVAVVSLALGIGVNAAMFSVIDAVLLRALPYPQPEQLVRVTQQDGRTDAVTVTEYDVLREQSRTFSSVAAYRGAGERRLGWSSGEDWIVTTYVTAGFLATLDVPPAIGREFNSEETRPGGPQAVILGNSVWRERFGADPTILGRLVTLDGTSFKIVGILPAAFWLREPTDALIPLRPTGGLDDLGINTQIMARLRNGVDLRQAQADVGTLTESFRRALADRAPPTYRGLSVSSYHAWLVGDVRLNLLLLFGATGLLLLIACVNLAMLLIARFTTREKEIAVRVALGSGRRRLLAQCLMENLVLAALGAGASVLAAYVLLRGLVSWVPFTLPAAAPIHLDGRVLGFALVVALATSVVFTLVPLFMTRRLNVHDALKSSGRTPDNVRTRTRNVLVVGEVALSATLLIAAGLLIHSLYRIQHERLGFEPDGLITFVTPFDPLRTAADRTAFTRAIRERLPSVPGVRDVAATNVLPLAGRGNLPTQRDAHPEQSIGGMEIRMVTPNYFEMLGIPVRRGRPFTSADVRTSLPVAVVNDTLARTWWPAGGAVGDRLVIGMFQGRKLTNDSPREVVGIVGDTKTLTLKDPARPTVFVPLDQAAGDTSRVAWIVRTDGSSGVAVNLRSAVAAIDRGQRVLQLRRMDEIVASTTATSRFNASLFALFAAVAVVLAAIGLYGVLSFLVAQRRHEVGTRMALGASRGDVLALFLRQGITLTAIGLGLGLGAALLLTRWLSSLLFSVQPRDPASFAAVAVLLLLVGVAASYVPARRAASIDPMANLRAE